MSFVLSSIVGGVNEQNSIGNSACVDNWTAKWVIVDSSVNNVRIDNWTAE